MIDYGYFGSDEQFELLEGWIVQKGSRNPVHDSVLNRTRRRVERVLPPGWMVRVQSAVTTIDSEPEPDVAVVRGDDGDYELRHPKAADSALVIEVANTSLMEDRTTKLRVYANASFVEYWIVNIESRSVEVYSDPATASAHYRSMITYALGQAVPLRVEGAEVGLIPVAELIG